MSVQLEGPPMESFGFVWRHRRSRSMAVVGDQDHFQRRLLAGRTGQHLSLRYTRVHCSLPTCLAGSRGSVA